MLTTEQRSKIRELATVAHDHRMRTVGLLRVKDEALRYKSRLARSLDDAKQLVDQLYPRFRQIEIMHQRGRINDGDFELETASYRKAKAVLDDLEGQMVEARAELDRLHERIDEENAKSAPSLQLIDRILRYARVTRAELGINFAESDSEFSASVASANAIQMRAGGVA